jgi:hypothetical protein
MRYAATSGRRAFPSKKIGSFGRVAGVSPSPGSTVTQPSSSVLAIIVILPQAPAPRVRTRRSPFFRSPGATAS